MKIGLILLSFFVFSINIWISGNINGVKLDKYKTCWCQDFYGNDHEPISVADCHQCTNQQCENLYGIGSEAYCGPQWLSKLRQR
ncbi:MAG TPA: hypothetical protein VHA52_06790 [Candidatus Babeliaceae bacterium]|nr:hypothetical protein [Candidatus Babeliaceae bacterium]